jgi:hypothetical protein
MKMIERLFMVLALTAAVSFAVPPDSTVSPAKADSITVPQKAEVAKNANVILPKKTPTSWTKLKDMFM